MFKRILSAIVVCLLVCTACAFAEGEYNYIDPSIVNGIDELPWVTITAKNDAPMDNGQTADKLFLDGTGEKIAMPEDANEWAAWLDDICANKTDGKGDFAFAKFSEENFLRVLYEVDDSLYMSYDRHVYSDNTRVIIKGLTAYVYWSTESDAIQHGAKIVYDDAAGKFNVSEFNLLTLDGTTDEIMIAANFGYIRNTSNFKVETESTGLNMRAEPTSEGEVIGKIEKGAEIALIFDYDVVADNGYTYVPVRNDTDAGTMYGWVARDYLGINEQVDSLTWVGRTADQLEYPTAK